MPKKRQNREERLPVLRPDAAGIDIGAEEIYVAVPAARDSQPVRRFATFRWCGGGNGHSHKKTHIVDDDDFLIHLFTQSEACT
jgi:hypothetical protein